MRIDIDFHVSATGKPKGHHSTKELYGVVTESFDVESDDVEMVKVIEIDYHHRNHATYYQNGDGHFYQKKTFDQILSEGSHIQFRQGLQHNIFGNRLAENTIRYMKKFTTAEMAANWYPRNPRDAAALTPLLNLYEMPVTNLSMKNLREARQQIESELKGCRVSNGVLYKRVPEPFIVITLERDQRANYENTIDVSLVCAEEFSQLRLQYYDDDDIVVIMNVGDKDRLIETVNDLAQSHNAYVCGGRVMDNEYKIVTYNPQSSYCDQNLIHYIAYKMEDTAARSLYGDKLEEVKQHIFLWTPEILECFKTLRRAVTNEEWFHDVDQMEEVVQRCIEADERYGTNIFTNPRTGFDCKMAFEQWQLRAINIDGLSF